LIAVSTIFNKLYLRLFFAPGMIRAAPARRGTVPASLPHSFSMQYPVLLRYYFARRGGIQMKRPALSALAAAALLLAAIPPSAAAQQQKSPAQQHSARLSD
jgi:hypothetical protein